MNEDGLQDLKKDTIGAHYLNVDQSDNFDSTSIFTVELPESEHNCPEIR